MVKSMSMEQLKMLEVNMRIAQKDDFKKRKRKWENAFQKWSDNNGMSDGAESWGACGYGSMCDYCEDNSYGRPCVRALNAMLRETGKHIDYTDFDFVKVWEDGGITFEGERA